MVAMIRGCGWHLVLHPVVLGSHRDGLRIYTVAEVLHPPHWRRHGLVVLLLDLGRLAVAASLRDDLFDVFRADPRRVVADVDHVVLPIEANVGDVRLLSQGSLDGTSAAQAVHATELERASSYGNMLVIGCCRSPGVVVGHGRYVLLNMVTSCRFLRQRLAPHSQHDERRYGTRPARRKPRHWANRRRSRWLSAKTFKMI